MSRNGSVHFGSSKKESKRAKQVDEAQVLGKVSGTEEQFEGYSSRRRANSGKMVSSIGALSPNSLKKKNAKKVKCGHARGGGKTPSNRRSNFGYRLRSLEGTASGYVNLPRRMVSVQADIRAYVRRDLGGSGASKGAGGDAINSNSFAPDSKRAKGDLAKDGPIRRSASKNDETGPMGKRQQLIAALRKGQKDAGRAIQAEICEHGDQCQLRGSGKCSRCNHIWAGLKTHARQCNNRRCSVQNCRSLRQLQCEIETKQSAMDDRRRASQKNKFLPGKSSAGAER